MDTLAIFVTILAGIFLPLLILWGGWSGQSTAAQYRAREHRIADAKMNARLLRLNI
ncbi:MAG TPA: hypothetical protein VN708_10995 [Terriglobales bacterium]|jgi:hypothetical protein|nr:hypothetical protein [Terriglobales bacterium]